MSKLHFTTKHANEATVKRDWYIVDGTNQTVGRVCSKIAAVLRGKNKASYTPHVDTGDYIIFINADKVKFTGTKLDDKVYINFSGYPGGKKEETAKNLLKRRPEVVKVIINSGKRFLPERHNPLFAPLSHHFERGVIHAVKIEGTQLGDAQSACV